MASDAPKIEPFLDSDLERVAAFIARLNANPEHHITFFENEEEVVARYLQGLSPHPREGFRLARVGDRLVGVLGAEYELEIGRTWLHGPLVDTADWHAVADLLYGAVAALLPEGIEEQDVACDSRNPYLPPFAKRQGFAPYKETLAMNIGRGQPVPEVEGRVRELDPSFGASVAELHDRTFPGTYYTGKQITEMRGETKQVFVVGDAGRADGYLFVEAEPENRSAFLHFVGVDESARRRGLGRALMSTAVRWAFSFPTVDVASLTVDIINPNALAWYERLGFRRERVILSYRKTRKA
jgi:ribosomal protein S18 acetylase RimI-like enzyme